MRTVSNFLLASLLVTCAVQAAPPPVIDRELFFGDPEISGGQISPDGKYIAFLKPLNKTRNIWVKLAAEPFASARPVTNDTKRPIRGFFWSRDSRYILFIQDKGGDENFNVYAVNPAEKLAAGAEVPAARNLTDAKGARAFIYAVPKTQPDLIYVGLNDRDKAWHDLYRVKLSTGERTLVRKNTDRITGWIFDNKDQLRLAQRSPDNGDTEILRVDPDKLTKIYSCGVFETCNPIRFHKDNSRVYLEANKGDDRNLTSLALLDAATGKEEPVESDPLKRVDLEGAFISELTDELLATSYVDDKTRMYWKDKSYEADYRRLEKELPGSEIRFGSHTADEQTWLISAASDTEPGATYLFDRKSKRLTKQYTIREKLPREYLAAMKPVRYESSDGLEIPAYLTLPKGVEPKSLPVIVMPHGGPWARDNWGYDSDAQFLANRGYAVLMPNFRGSTGYGKSFLNAGNRAWGDKMQDDVTWGVKYLVAQGIADPKRVGIMGGSYGGYATLAGVAFTPDVYSAAVAIVAPSNLITLLNSIPPYWEPIRKLFYERMGDPTTPEGKAQLVRQSPLNSAAKIRTPLLVVQGANDPRVNRAESDQIVIALRDRGFPVEYLVAPDEGHGFARPVNNMAMMVAAEKFLARHLGGRYQEGATPEVAERLREITVDPKTVVLQKKAEPASTETPKPAAALPTGALKYQATVKMGEREVKMNLATTIQEAPGGITITDAMSTPMGDTTDTVRLDKSTLQVLERSVKQGQVTMNVKFRDGKATGTFDAGSGQKPIDAELDGPLFADGPGSGQVVATLPLAEGYTTSFRNFDLQKQRERLMRLNVTGSESVTVPAGKFESYKLDITSADGGPDKATLWIAKEPRKMVKLTAAMPDMGGATLTAELVQ